MKTIHLMSCTAFIFLLTLVQVGGVGHTSEWGAWSDWTQCSVTCGYGSITKTGYWFDKNGVKTNESYVQRVGCYLNVKCPVNGNWTMWPPYSACSKPCGPGIRTRSRTCTNPTPRNGGSECIGPDMDQKPCNLQDCPPIPPNFNLSICSNPSMMWCTNKHMCVGKNQRCDRTVQCNDGSDEHLCYKYINTSPSFPNSIVLVTIWTVISTIVILA